MIPLPVVEFASFLRIHTFSIALQHHIFNFILLLLLLTCNTNDKLLCNGNFLGIYTIYEVGH